jgi:hypothetical protein
VVVLTYVWSVDTVSGCAEKDRLSGVCDKTHKTHETHVPSMEMKKSKSSTTEAMARR